MKKLLIVLITSMLTLSACASNNAPQPETQHEFTIEELGDTIAAAGAFWEDWWNLTGRFDFNQHFELFEGEPLPEHYVTFSDEHNAWMERQSVLFEEHLAKFPQHLLDIGAAFEILLPSSGFTSLDDIRNYLLQYYTESWIDVELPREMLIFAEYDGVLFVNVTRAGFPRPSWETATYTLVEQDGSHTVVETTVLMSMWHIGHEHVHSWEAHHLITFIDGRIDSGGNWPWFAE